jgi:hypothetical protein
MTIAAGPFGRHQVGKAGVAVGVLCWSRNHLPLDAQGGREIGEVGRRAPVGRDLAWGGTAGGGGHRRGCRNGGAAIHAAIRWSG